jgi:hypothetical protein
VRPEQAAVCANAATVGASRYKGLSDGGLQVIRGKAQATTRDGPIEPVPAARSDNRCHSTLLPGLIGPDGESD